MEIEIWKPVDGYEGAYEVSNLGRVRSVDRIVNTNNGHKEYSYLVKGKLLKMSYNCKGESGYPVVSLCKDGVAKGHTVHRLVATAFIPNPNNLPVVNHIDCNPSNNAVANLEWCTQSENILWGVACGTFTKGHPSISQKLIDMLSKPVYCVELDREFSSQTEAIEALGVGHDYLRDSVRRKGVKSKNYYDLQNKYTLIWPEDKSEYLNYIEQENAVTRDLFTYGRHAVDLKTLKVFNTRSEFCNYYNIPDGTASGKFYTQFDGYLPKYDCYLVDIGYRQKLEISDEDRMSKMIQMKINFVRRYAKNLIRCDTTGKLYKSAQDAEADLNLPGGCVRERLALYDGYYFKRHLHFSSVSPDDVSEAELLSISNDLAATFEHKSGGRQRNV